MSFVTSTHSGIYNCKPFIFDTVLGRGICDLLIMKHERGVTVIVMEKEENQAPPITQCWPELANQIWMECLGSVQPAGNIRFYESEDGDNFTEIVFSEIPGEDDFDQWSACYKVPVVGGHNGKSDQN